MKVVSFAHAETGIFNGGHIVVSDESMVAANTPPDHRPVEGLFDHLSQRLDLSTGKAVDYQPPAPSADHEWNGDMKRWLLKAAAQARLDRRRSALEGIAELEAAQPRAIREVVLAAPGSAELTGAIARLQGLDDQIKALRQKL